MVCRGLGFGGGQREVGRKLVPPGDGRQWDGLQSRITVELEASVGSR